MKYPKLRDGANAVGESQLRQLAGVDTPFLKKAGANSISYTRNGFPEVHQKTGEPYLWGAYVVNTGLGAQIFTALLSPEDALASTVRYKANYNFGTTNVDASAFKAFVGDNYVLRLFANSAFAIDNPSTLFWPSIARADALGTEFLATQDGHERRSISYIDSVVLSGLGLFAHGFSLWACGWQDDTARFRFGVGCSYFTDVLNPTTTRVPLMFVGSTGEYAMAQVSYPYYPGRDHFRSTCFTAGPGQLLALHALTEDTTEAKIPAYFAQSVDFGATWTTDTPTLFDTALYQHPAVGPTRAYYDNDQLETMTAYAVITYVGAGKIMLYLPNVYVDGSMSGGTARFCPALYLGDSGGFTRLTWPPDTWYVDEVGLPRALSGTVDKVGFTYMLALRSAQYSMGVGCFHAPVYQGGAWRILSTRDFGASWAYSPAVPLDFIAPTTADFAGTAVLPYESAEKPGRMIFSAPDYTANRLRFQVCDGTFAEFRPLGTVVKAAGDLIPTGVDDTNYYFVNYGGKRFKPCVFPAFPDEFNKP